MGRAPCCSKVGLHKGPWSSKEDILLTQYIEANGEGQWRSMPKKAGLLRCGKSCRLRWLNYLRPGIKRGNITADEEDLIIRLHNLLGNRWSLIAGRLPGRTDNEIKNHWNTHLQKKLLNAKNEAANAKKAYPVVDETRATKQKRDNIRNNPTTISSSHRKKKQKQNNIRGKAMDETTTADKISIPTTPTSVAAASSSSSTKNNISSGIVINTSNLTSHEELVDREIIDKGASDLQWPWVELADVSDYIEGGVQMCDPDILCGFNLSLQCSVPTYDDILDRVYGEYLQLL